MSRDIKTTSPRLSNEEFALRNTSQGKLLFCTYREQMCAFLLRNNRLLAVEVLPEADDLLGAVYIGKVKNVVKNIDACFVEIANGEICFLPLKDAKYPMILNRNFDGRILEGDEILVQIIREAQKTKQATVTTNISISNDYVAISIGSAKTGYSNKLSKEQKQEIESWLKDSSEEHSKECPQDYSQDCLQDYSLKDSKEYSRNDSPEHSNKLPSYGIVVRTKAGECQREEFLAHLEALLKEFMHLFQIAVHRTCYSCVRKAPDALWATIDKIAYSHEYDEIVTDDIELFEKLKSKYSENIKAEGFEIQNCDLPLRIRLYEDKSLSLSKLYGLESKMEEALGKRVWLKSGGYLIIEQTEAMTVIDVNSGKYEAKKASEETYMLINREAAEEIALQLRLRNLSGIIIVDFINLKSSDARLELLEYCKKLAQKDKIKTNIIDMTPLGLVEITRKKQNKTIYERFR